jgi:hypothetical protein
MDGKFWDSIKKSAGLLGRTMLSLGFLALIVAFFLTIFNKPATETIGLMLGSFSVGLGFMAIDMSNKSDSKYTNLLNQLKQGVINLPTLFKNDVLSPSGQLAVKMQVSNESKESAQNRLDDDTKRVGRVRGELYQLPNGSWGIHWGGKYPL